MNTKSTFNDTASAAAALAGNPAVEKDVQKEINRASVVARLISIRVAKGITQEQIAKQLDCDPSKISRLEAGNDLALRWIDLVGYASALGMGISLSFEDPDIPAATKIKQCVYGIQEGLEELSGLAKRLGADDEITQKIHQFYGEVLFNFLIRYKDGCDAIGMPIKIPTRLLNPSHAHVIDALEKDSTETHLQPA